MIEFCVGYIMGVLTMCLFQINKGGYDEEEKTGCKKKKYTGYKK